MASIRPDPALPARRGREGPGGGAERKSSPTTWDAFWLVAVCDWTVERTAKALGMTHTAVYAARERVARMLCDEGKRVSDRWAAGS